MAYQNWLYWLRDVTLGEEQCQVHKGVALLMLAALNNVVLAFFDFLVTANIPQQIVAWRHNPRGPSVLFWVPY